MKKLNSRNIILVLAALVLCGCPALRQEPAAVLVKPDYEFRDVRELPQDLGIYASAGSGDILGEPQRDAFLADFRRTYFSPWDETASLPAVDDSIKTMREHASREWYGENKRKVPTARMGELLANCDLEHFPSMDRIAIATAPTALRVLPTSRPLFKKSDDFPFDMLQNGELKMNEPVRVLHLSSDGLWYFVSSADAHGWVDARDIGFLDKKSADKWRRSPLLVVTKDATLVRNQSERISRIVNTGTLLPIAGENDKTYQVRMAISGERNMIISVPATVAKAAVQPFPLELSGKTAALVGNELIGKPYGWGESFHYRDCSGLTRDFFLPFGILLPRGSWNQIHSGKAVSFAGLDGDEKERLILEKGVPFLTLISLKGHIMLYVGSRDGRAIILHSIWGVSLKNGDGSVSKHVVGKSVVSTLTLGSECNISGGTLLERADGMLVLSNGQATSEP